MKKLFLLGILFVLFASSVFAIECQYTKEVINSTETKFIPYDLDGDQLDEIQIEFNVLWNQPAKIINPNSVDLDIILKINLNIKSKQWCNGYSHPLDFIRTKELTIPANSFIELQTEKPVSNHYCDEFRWSEPVEIQYQGSDEVEVKLTTIENKFLVCDGKDDGVLCNSPNECGGGFCIEGHCSNTELCFNNECKCDSDEIQCSNNKQCVQKQVVPLDVKPKCDLNEECVSGYISLESGLCAKSPAQINEENEQRKKLYLFLGISFILLLVVGMFIFYSYKNKSKKLDIEKIEAEYKKIQYEIEQKNNEIEELKAKTNKTKEESKRLKNLSSELTEQIAHFEKTSKNFFIKKYTERYGNKIYLDTEKEYIRFKSNNEFLHRYIYKSFYENFNEAKEVHHIDANHYNNEIWNLIALTTEQHRKIKHGKILYGDWVSGINELRRIGLSDRDLPREVIKRLRNQ